MEGMEKLFSKLGMSGSEARAYSALLKSGPCTARELSSASSLYRTNLYDVLRKLKGKGLVCSYLKNGVMHFSAAEPKILFDRCSRKEAEYADLRKSLSEALEKLEKRHQDRSGVSVFEGQEALGHFYERLVEIAESHDEVLIIASNEVILDAFRYYFISMSKRIRTVNVKARMVAKKSLVRNAVLKKIRSLSDIRLRFLPKHLIGPAAVFVFRDFVGFSSFSISPFVVLVENPAFAESYRGYFQGLWAAAES